MVTDSKCRPEITLILPDGATFRLSDGPGYVMGSAAGVVGLQGFGLPSVSHTTQEIYDTPGVTLRGVTVEARTVDVVLSLWSTDGTRHGLHRVRASLLDSLRWDRGPSDTTLATLRYSMGGKSADLHLTFSGVVESDLGRFGLNQTLAVRFLCPDPMFYAVDSESQVLDWSDAYTMRSIAAKIGGIWTPLGPPSAVGGSREPDTIVVDPDTGDIIVGGSFTGWDGLAGVTGDYVVRYDVSASAWVSMGGGLNGRCYRLFHGPDGTLFAAGNFTNGSGGVGDPTADYLAQYNPAGAGSWVGVGGGGTGALMDIVIGHDGTMYLCGAFANWDGVAAADNLVSLPLPYSAGVWTAIGTPDAACYSLAVMPTGHIILGGNYDHIDGVDYASVAEYDPVAGTWAAMGLGLDSSPYSMAVAPDGSLYMGGAFIRLGPIGAPDMFYITKWTGSQYEGLDGGMDDVVWVLDVDSGGNVYVAGPFLQAGSLTTPDGVARWNGFAWVHTDLDPPGAAGVHTITESGGDLFVGFDTAAGIGYVAGDNVVTNAGSAPTYPTIEIKNAGLLKSIVSKTTGDELFFNLQLLDGEILTVDLSTGKKTLTSNWRGNRLGDLLPNSDLGTFKLESYPRADYGGVAGSNLLSAFIENADPRESGDNNNQLSGWTGLTGVSSDNSDAGKAYVSIIADGGGFYHVGLYMDAARTLLVGHTGTYNGAGAQAVIEDGASGLGGTITIDAVVGADVDIYVYFTLCEMRWYNRFWSLDEAIGGP